MSHLNITFKLARSNSKALKLYCGVWLLGKCLFTPDKNKGAYAPFYIWLALIRNFDS